MRYSEKRNYDVDDEPKVTIFDQSPQGTCGGVKSSNSNENISADELSPDEYQIGGTSILASGEVTDRMSQYKSPKRISSIKRSSEMFSSTKRPPCAPYRETINLSNALRKNKSDLKLPMKPLQKTRLPLQLSMKKQDKSINNTKDLFESHDGYMPPSEQDFFSRIKAKNE